MPIYYIDGYNVVYHASALHAVPLSDFEAGRDRLVELVTRFSVATGSPIKVVFDGSGRRAENGAVASLAAGVEVLYSPGHQSADALIEREIYLLANRGDVIVVSGDRGLRELCRGLGAMVMSSDNFLETVRETLGRALLEQTHRQNSANIERLEDRLTREERNHIEQLKKRLP
jgi:predicted RNA-binding protein with PIN domain